MPVILVLSVTVSNGALPPKMVARALTEAGAIWREAGVSIEWRSEETLTESAALRVEFGDAGGREQPGQVPIAWIGLAEHLPTNEIYVSRSNAVRLLQSSRELTAEMALLPAAIDEFAGRALGRALAHEIGHYLFRSPEHDTKGVMATKRPTAELFATDRAHFLLTSAERTRLAAVIARTRLAASQATPPAVASKTRSGGPPLG